MTRKVVKKKSMLSSKAAVNQVRSLTDDSLRSLAKAVHNENRLRDARKQLSRLKKQKDGPRFIAQVKNLIDALNEAKVPKKKEFQGEFLGIKFSVVRKFDPSQLATAIAHEHIDRLFEADKDIGFKLPEDMPKRERKFLNMELPEMLQAMCFEGFAIMFPKWNKLP